MNTIEALHLVTPSKAPQLYLPHFTCLGVALITDVLRAPNGTCSTRHCVPRPFTAPVRHPVVHVA